MVDFKIQYEWLKLEIDVVVQEVLQFCVYINGFVVKFFKVYMEFYLDVCYVIFCVNGMDVFQIVFMGVGLQLGDEVIVFVFIYVFIVEVIVFFNLKLVMVDVDLDIFNVIVDLVEVVIMLKIKVVVLVNFFGQSCDFEFIMEVVKVYGLWVIEDNVQAIGVDYIFKDGYIQKMGIIGYIGCIFFYFFKNLGVYGDGGVLYINDEVLGQ